MAMSAVLAFQLVPSTCRSAGSRGPSCATLAASPSGGMRALPAIFAYLHSHNPRADKTPYTCVVSAHPKQGGVVNHPFLSIRGILVAPCMQ